MSEMKFSVPLHPLSCENVFMQRYAITNFESFQQEGLSELCTLNASAKSTTSLLAPSQQEGDSAGGKLFCSWNN